MHVNIPTSFVKRMTHTGASGGKPCGIGAGRHGCFARSGIATNLSYTRRVEQGFAPMSAPNYLT